ncbi:MAG: hypothetical protein PHP25_02465 [Candidatus Moranbacteria bacterium]|nr:hypothetical protein [Candidatus Moranbacteria bacterium]
MLKVWNNEKFRVIVFYTILTIILTWPTAIHFFSSVPSSGSDTMQVIGVAGDKANLLSDRGFFKGTFELIKRSEFNITALYAYFQLFFGRIAGYNLLFFASFVLSGFGAYLLAFFFTKSKPASLIAGIIFAFSPFHFHNALSTNVGTMHQEWLPFFALYLFRFFENLSLKNFSIAGLFLLLIGFTEHQLLAFTVIFILFFLVYKLFVQPKAYLRPKFWIYAGVSLFVLSVLFFFMFRSLFAIAGSKNNFLDPGFKAAVKYSNDSLSILIPPNSHSLWPGAFLKIRNQFERQSDSNFSVYAGYLVLFLSLLAVLGIRWLKRAHISTKGVFFWLVVAVGFYALSLGPYLHYKGILNPPVKMPYFLVYQYLPFYKNIRTVGRLFVWSMLGFSVLAAWGSIFLQNILQKKVQSLKLSPEADQPLADKNKNTDWRKYAKANILYLFIGLVVILEFLAIPLKTDSLLHSSFYEKLGQDKEKYSVLEVPGSTSYDFASRDLVWKSIHRKNTINSYDFARVNKESNQFQRGTPIIRTLLYDIPEGTSGNDSDIAKSSYYDISNEILNYYNIRWIILDKEGLKGKPEKGDSNMLYPAKAYITSVIKCADEYEDDYLYACKVGQSGIPEHMFLAMDYSNRHWVGKSKAKNGIQRWAENGAGVKLVNMASQTKTGQLKLNLKVSKPLRITVALNGKEIYNKYIASVGQKQVISADMADIRPGENDIVFGVFASDGQEIRSEKKSDTAVVYQLEVE